MVAVVGVLAAPPPVVGVLAAVVGAAPPDADVEAGAVAVEEGGALVVEEVEVVELLDADLELWWGAAVTLAPPVGTVNGGAPLVLVDAAPPPQALTAEQTTAATHNQSAERARCRLRRARRTTRRERSSACRTWGSR